VGEPVVAVVGSAEDALVGSLWELAGFSGEAGHVAEAVFGEEARPGVGAGIGLGEGADEGVEVEAEGGAGDAVEVGEEFGGVAVGGGVGGGGAVDPGENEEGGLGVEDAGDGEAGMVGEIAEHAGFEVERRGVAAVDLDGDGFARDGGAVDFGDAAAGEGARVARGGAECAGDGFGGCGVEHWRR
jgi:hypothetical protein